MTASHPFAVWPERGGVVLGLRDEERSLGNGALSWIRSGNLSETDTLLTRSFGPAESGRIHRHVVTQPVYNIEIEGLHNYAVGEHGVLVHNKAATNLGRSVRTAERKKPCRDGATSRHIIEKIDGNNNSVTHQVTKEGTVIHQHQTHVGRHGTERQFPDGWADYPAIK